MLTVETGAGFLPCWTGRGRGVKPGEGPTGPGKWASACPKSGVLWGSERREGLSTLWARPGTPEPEWGGMGRRRPVVPQSSTSRAQATNLSVRMCQWSRGSSCVSPDPFPSKHRGLPAPTTTKIASLACPGRLLPSPPFLLSSQLGPFSIGPVHPPSGPMLPPAAGRRSARRTPHPPRRPPTRPPPLRPRKPAKHAGIWRPLLGTDYIRRAVRSSRHTRFQLLLVCVEEPTRILTAT